MSTKNLFVNMDLKIMAKAIIQIQSTPTINRGVNLCSIVLLSSIGNNLIKQISSKKNLKNEVKK